MSGPNAARTLPPGDREDAPLLALEERAPPRGEEPAQRDLLRDGAPSPTEIEQSVVEDRLLRCSRALTEALKDLMEFQIARERDDRLAMQAAAKRLAANATDAAPLARLIERAAVAGGHKPKE